MLYANQLLERFLTYVSFNTQSRIGAKIPPSSEGQLKLVQYLGKELQALGLEDIRINSYGILTALLPSKIQNAPTIGFISHLDTSPQYSGKNVNPEVIHNYRGGDIALGPGDEFLSPVTYPFLRQLIGKTLIVSDGSTLLGADSKAGIAEIMTALAILKESNQLYCNIRVAFTPDEEIGLGMNFFPLEQFSCDWAYTVDGGEIGELAYENFNTATAVVTFYGYKTHIGYAKNKMVNALTLACEFQQGFPKDEVPELTDKKVGFYHLESFCGDLEKVKLNYLIQDFDRKHFEQRKEFIEKWVAEFNVHKNLDEPVKLVVTDNYKNMYEVVQKVPFAIQLAEQAMQKCEIMLLHKPIRGRTCGVWLAEQGLACPNIFTGGYNFHSKHEVISLEDMLAATQVITTIAALAVENKKLS